MKNNYGKLTKKKAIDLLNEYDFLLTLIPYKILDVEILKSKGECDCAEILIKYAGTIDKYFISCYGISVTTLTENEIKIITDKNIFLESEEKTK